MRHEVLILIEQERWFRIQDTEDVLERLAKSCDLGFVFNSLRAISSRAIWYILEPKVVYTGCVLVEMGVEYRYLVEDCVVQTVIGTSIGPDTFGEPWCRLRLPIRRSLAELEWGEHKLITPHLLLFPTPVTHTAAFQDFVNNRYSTLCLSQSSRYCFILGNYQTRFPITNSMGRDRNNGKYWRYPWWNLFDLIGSGYSKTRYRN